MLSDRSTTSRCRRFPSRTACSRRSNTMQRAVMHHYANQLIDLLLVLIAAWMVPAGIFFIYAYFAGLKYPVGESVVGRLLVISFFLITASIWLPIIVSALALSLMGFFWSRIRAKRDSSSARPGWTAAPRIAARA